MENSRVYDIRDREIDRLRKENDDLRRLLFAEIYLKMIKETGVMGAAAYIKQEDLIEFDKDLKLKAYEVIDLLLEEKGKTYKGYGMKSREMWGEVKVLLEMEHKAI